MDCACGGKMKVEDVEISPGVFSEGYVCKKCDEVQFSKEQMIKATNLVCRNEKK